MSLFQGKKTKSVFTFQSIGKYIYMFQSLVYISLNGKGVKFGNLDLWFFILNINFEYLK